MTPAATSVNGLLRPSVSCSSLLCGFMPVLIHKYIIDILPELFSVQHSSSFNSSHLFIAYLAHHRLNKLERSTIQNRGSKQDAEL